MHAKSIALTLTLMVATSVVAVEPEHPRIYFPREIKREFIRDRNPLSVSSGLNAGDASSPVKQSLWQELISGLGGLGGAEEKKNGTSSRQPPSSTTQSSSSSVLDVSSDTDTQPTTSTSRSISTDTDSGIVVGPTGIESTSSTDSPSSLSTETSDTQSSDATSQRFTSTSSSDDNDPFPSSTPFSTTTSSGTDDETSSTSESETPFSTPPPIITSGGDVFNVSSTTTSDPLVTSSTSTSGDAIITTSGLPDFNITSGTSDLITSDSMSLTEISTSNGTISIPPPSTTDTVTTISGNSTFGELPPMTSSTLPVTETSVTTAGPVTFSTSNTPPPASDSWLPSDMIVNTSPASPPSATAPSTEIPTSTPPSPQNIVPEGGDVPQPDDTTAIRIGFKRELSFEFVSNNPTAASQIMVYLPRGLWLASGLQTSQNNSRITIPALSSLTNPATSGYNTTIARLYYPTSLLGKLQADLITANSPLYKTSDSQVNGLTMYIDPTVPLFDDGTPGGAAGPGSGAGGSGGGSSGNDAFGTNSNQPQSSKQKATTAGIAVGAVSLSVIYGAAMFVIARRYKRKRQGHRRSSSVTSSQGSPEMRYRDNSSPPLMGGALMSRGPSPFGDFGGRDSQASGGRQSARTAGISAPVATENSLGWN